MRIDFDSSFHDAVNPFVNLDPAKQQNALKTCHAVIARDFNEHVFLSEYKLAAELMADEELPDLKDYLEKMYTISPDGLNTIKVSSARILTMKPHSADVERLISKCKSFLSHTARLLNIF